MIDINLLNELKDKLNITWDEETTNRELNRLISRGIKYFNELCEKEFTFEEDSKERELLMERCRYAWNSALDDFEINYKKELSRLIQSVALEQYVGEISGT